MNLFFTNHIEGNYAYLDEIESRHCVQVLRKKTGETIQFIDGNGGFYKGIIEEAHKKKCVLKIESQKLEFDKRNFRLHIGIAPTKNINRFEWFLEKVTEIGIDQITPIFCEHSERKRIRLDRLEKIILSATKQSLKAYLPILNEPQKALEFIEKQEHGNQKFIAHCQEGDKKSLKESYQLAGDVCLLIGPEGDFSKEEVAFANKHDFSSISLGKSRLRTETAGIVACQILNFLNE